MSGSLNALLTKLSWQKIEVSEQLHHSEQEGLRLNEDISALNQQLNYAHAPSKLINPDWEINRLNFNLHVQEEKSALEASLKEQQELCEILNQKMLRIKTELKVLEQYLSRKTTELCQEQKKQEEQALEEWVIQKREFV
jgi:hypothetical protein